MAGIGHYVGGVEYISKEGYNTSLTALNNGETFTGTSERNDAPDVMVSCKIDADCTLYFDFSNDGTNWDTFPVNGFLVSSGIHEFHTAVKGQRYFRTRLVNASGSNATYLRLYTYYGQYRQPNAPLNQSISADSDAVISRAVLVGATDGNTYKNVPVTTEGHLEVAIHGPRLPFGSVHRKLTPIFQSDAVYGITEGEETASATLSGTATATDSLFTVSTGTTQYSQAVIQGDKRLRYRPGQGVVGRFTALFTTPVANAYQLAGFGHAEDGVYVGYGDTNDLTNTEFGILYVNRGKREVQTLTITTGSSTAENVTVTLNSVAFSIAVTNSADIQRTVWEISNGTYAGWKAYPNDDTVIFVADSAGNKAGTFSLAGTTAVGTFAETQAGVASTDLFIPQSEFNVDTIDGTGPSGFNIDPTKGNVFQIGIQYLGFGGITFAVENAPSGNNPDFVTFHVIRAPNTLTTTTFGNPSFPFSMAAYSAGSTTDLTVKVGSYAGFVEGPKMLHGKRFTYIANKGNNVVQSGAYYAMFTIQCNRYHKGRTSQVVVNLLSITAAVKHTSPVVFYIVRDADLVGNPDFQALSTTSATSWDTAATTGTWADNDQLVWTGSLGETGELDHHFGNGSFNAEEITLQPGERMTLFARTASGNSSFVTATINTREDQ